MTAYQRDDGAEMVEYKPGRTIPRDVGICLGLIAPEIRIGSGRPAAVSSATSPQPEPAAPPPLQPSHEDLVSAAPKPAAVARVRLDDDDLARRAVCLIADSVTGPGLEISHDAVALTRTFKPRPAKRSLSAILAVSDRGHRALRAKVRP